MDLQGIGADDAAPPADIIGSRTPRSIGCWRQRAAPRRARRAARRRRIVALSGRNQLRAVVDEVRVDGLLAQVRLSVGGQSLTAVITRDAVDELKLRRGDEALAVVKSTEVMIGRTAIRPDVRAARSPRIRPQPAQSTSDQALTLRSPGQRRALFCLSSR